MHAAAGLGPEPDGGGRTVRHQHRDGQHGDLAQALGLQQVVLAEQGSAPPMPVPTTTPSRSGSSSGAPASAQASRAATSATCWHRSSRRASTRGSTSVGSTASGAWIAHRQVVLLDPRLGERRDADRPSSMACQVSGAVPPMGVVAPMPVTTTSWSWPASMSSPAQLCRPAASVMQCPARRARTLSVTPAAAASGAPRLGEPVTPCCARCSRRRRRRSSGWPARRPGS